jgi:Tol biopolymer transport system component
MISSLFLVVNLRDPSISADNLRVAFIATDYNTKVDGAYLAIINPTSPNPQDTKFYKLSQDSASYTGITISPDGTKAVAVRNDGSTTDLVVFDLSNLGAPAAPAQVPVTAAPTEALGPGTLPAPTMPAPPVASSGIPIRPLTTDGNTLIEGSPSFSWDGTKVVYDAASSSAPNNRDLYVITVGASPSTGLPIMTLDGNDISPVFSPDGNYVAFASDRETGIYNIYIYDSTTKATYQLSADPDAAFPSSWNN